jgi:hypothetical protein
VVVKATNLIFIEWNIKFKCPTPWQRFAWEEKIFACLQGREKYFIFWDCKEKWENFLRVVDTANPV